MRLGERRGWGNALSRERAHASRIRNLLTVSILQIPQRLAKVRHWTGNVTLCPLDARQTGASSGRIHRPPSRFYAALCAWGGEGNEGNREQCIANEHFL